MESMTKHVSPVPPAAHLVLGDGMSFEKMLHTVCGRRNGAHAIPDRLEWVWPCPQEFPLDIQLLQVYVKTTKMLYVNDLILFYLWISFSPLSRKNTCALKILSAFKKKCRQFQITHYFPRCRSKLSQRCLYKWLIKQPVSSQSFSFRQLRTAPYGLHMNGSRNNHFGSHNGAIPYLCNRGQATNLKPHSHIYCSHNPFMAMCIVIKWFFYDTNCRLLTVMFVSTLDNKIIFYAHSVIGVLFIWLFVHEDDVHEINWYMFMTLYIYHTYIYICVCVSSWKCTLIWNTTFVCYCISGFHGHLVQSRKRRFVWHSGSNTHVVRPQGNETDCNAKLPTRGWPSAGNNLIK